MNKVVYYIILLNILRVDIGFYYILYLNIKIDLIILILYLNIKYNIK